MPQPYDGPWIDARCLDCDAKLVTQRRWPHDAAERREMRADGYEKHGTGPYCARHAQKRRRAAA